MNGNLMKTAFKKTIPVMAGYLFLGIAFGILMSNSGYSVLWSILMSVFIYAGTAQFLAVSLLTAHAPFLQVALLTFILNFRHFFYGISMITKYRGKGKLKAYLIFGLTDETYAILSGEKLPKGLDEKKYYLAVTLLDHSYWVLGTIIGATAGALITIDLSGIDFAMTALFAVIVVENWKNSKDHFPAVIGFFVSLICLVIFGTGNYLIPALLLITCILLVMKEIKSVKERAHE